MREQLEQVFSLGKGEFLVELKLLFSCKNNDFIYPLRVNNLPLRLKISKRSIVHYA